MADEIKFSYDSYARLQLRLTHFPCTVCFQSAIWESEKLENVTYASGASGMCLEDFYSLFLDNLLERRCWATEKED